jgi:hypothetical protein
VHGDGRREQGRSQHPTRIYRAPRHKLNFPQHALYRANFTTSQSPNALQQSLFQP